MSDRSFGHKADFILKKNLKRPISIFLPYTYTFSKKKLESVYQLNDFRCDRIKKTFYGIRHVGL